MKWFSRLGFLCFVCVGIIAGLAFWIQSDLYINWDVAWDLLGSQTLLNTPDPLRHFFDLNPPMNILFYAPAFWFAKSFHLNLNLGLLIYLFCISGLSLWLCYYLSRKIFLNDEKCLPFFISSIAILILIFPLLDWAEREHLALILTLPYYLMMACRIEKKTVNGALACLIALMAAVGFMMKPYFMICLGLLEIYYWMLHRKLSAFYRPEVLVIFVYSLSFVLLTVLWYPEYLTKMVPEAQAFYYLSMHNAWLSVFLQPAVIYACLALLVYGFIQRLNRFPALGATLGLACMGFLIAYFIQQTIWDYHVFPAFCFGILLFVLFALSAWISRQNVMLILLMLFVLQYPVCYLLGKSQDTLDSEHLHAHMIQSMQTLMKGKSMLAITSSANRIFPCPLYTNTTYVSRFMHNYWLPAIMKLEMRPAGLSLEQKKLETDLREMLIADIRSNHPDYIIVDTRSNKMYFENIPFDYLGYFWKDPQFRQAFQSYRYLSTIELRSDFPVSLLKAWDLAIVSKRDMLDPRQFHQNTVVLVGDAEVKTVYLIKSGAWDRSQYHLFSFLYSPMPDEARFLKDQPPGLIRKTEANQKMLEAILAKNVNLPVYRYQIYRRETS